MLEGQEQSAVVETEAPVVEQTEVKADPVAEVEATKQETEQEPTKEAPQRDDQGKFKPKVQQRIDEITRARHNAEREAAYWKARVEGSGKEQEVKAQEKPTPDKFSDYSEYVESLTEWKADQKVKEALSARDAEKASEAQAKADRARGDVWSERQNAARTTLTDYDEVVGLSDIQVAQHVSETLLESESGPQLAYHLAKHPEVAQRLNSMSPLAAAREIGHLEATLGKPAAQTKPASNAPAPIKPIGGGTKTSSGDLAKMPMDQYMEMRKSQGARWSR